MRGTHGLAYALLVLAAFVLACVGGSNRTGNNPSSQSSQCPLKLEQAPEVKGFRLGMTTDQVRKQVPQFKGTKSDEFGFSEVFLINGKPKYPVPAGIEVKNIDSLMVRLGILKGRVISVSSYTVPNTTVYAYQGQAPEGVSLETYQERVPESLKIPHKLGDDPNSTQYLSLTCDGFKVKAGQENIRYRSDWLPTAYWFYSIEETAATDTLEQQRKQMKVEKEKQERQEREKKAGEFKP
jgi:hypothetical protein